MVDVKLRGGLHLRLRTERDSKPSCVQHRNVIRTISHCYCLLDLTALHIGNHGQQGSLTLGSDDRSTGASSEEARLLVHLQSVGEGVVKTKLSLNLLCHWQESTRDHCHLIPKLLQCAAELLGSRCEDKVLLHLPKKILSMMTFQQLHSRLERLVEVEFSPHSRLGEGLHLLAHAGNFGQLIDDLLLDQRAIHVKDDQPSHPAVDVVLLEGDVRAQRPRQAEELGGEVLRALQISRQIHCDLQRSKLVDAEPLDLHNIHPVLREITQDCAQTLTTNLRPLNHCDDMPILEVVLPAGLRAFGRQGLFDLLVQIDLEAIAMAGEEQILQQLH
mmetsp:Transcript_93408/g.168739  ORF Transcript_93408/g.168739 Transcript_93408/m.168739 type:complete len:330 (-) Transcript_93408:157-1146(-)